VSLRESVATEAISQCKYREIAALPLVARNDEPVGSMISPQTFMPMGAPQAHAVLPRKSPSLLPSPPAGEGVDGGIMGVADFHAHWSANGSCGIASTRRVRGNLTAKSGIASLRSQ